MSAMNREQHGPFTLNQVLTAELKALRPERFAELRGTPFPAEGDPRANEDGRSSNLHEIYREIATLDGDERLSALCFSGGGIRSATFNLGVLQALARAGVLSKFDYLSTVSGGGYIGGWLKAWMHRSSTSVQKALSADPAAPLKPEPRPVDRLREYSNFLTPRAGLMSGDTWAAIATVVRNIILNWLVVVPLLMVAVAVPILFLDVQELGETSLGVYALVLGLALASIGAAFAQRARFEGSIETDAVLRYSLAPAGLGAALVILGGAWLPPSLQSSGTLMLVTGAWCLLVPLLGWAIATVLDRDSAMHPMLQRAELFAVVVSGLITTLLMFSIAGSTFAALQPLPALFALLAPTVLLAMHLVARTLHVALADWASAFWNVPHAGHVEDAAREWWARYSGYIMLGMISWIVLGGLSLFGWQMLHRAFHEYTAHAAAGAGGIAGAIAALVGRSGSSPSGREGGATSSRLQVWAIGLALPLLCLATVPLMARGYVLLAAALHRLSPAHPTITLVLPAAALVLISCVAGVFVNVNRFSLHGFYRNRIVRAYLGASNINRRPDPFTGFDPTDNLKMTALWPDPSQPDYARMRDAGNLKPLHVINTTLNLVRGERLAWQERKAESFSISPFYCGNFYAGYRHASEYGGRGGISLGTAMAISGAAANPNMGFYSSPAVTFLLALLNGRLGAWLGNPNRNGDDTYRETAPRWAVSLMLDELLGRTRADTPYVQLSDGGHFENLGVYEMVLRRCRLIVATDAASDPAGDFRDLGNVIRKVRIDFGIDIVFDEPIRILPRADKGPGLAAAIGRIRYSDADGAGVPDGTLIYVKPTIVSDGVLPYDVFSYARGSAAFPHESTADQWFDESQFESYRILGEHLVDRLTGRTSFNSLSEFGAAAAAYVGAAPPAERGEPVVA